MDRLKTTLKAKTIRMAQKVILEFIINMSLYSDLGLGKALNWEIFTQL
jgi:hypothetical protein